MKPFQLIRLIWIIPVLLLICNCTEDKISPFGTGSIEGKVLDEEDLSPVANAEVSTSPSSHTVLTDSAGSFFMQDVEVGEYNVIAKKRDYFTASTAMKVNINATTQVMINLSKRPAEVDLPWFTGKYYPLNSQIQVPVNTNISWQLDNSSDSVEFNLKLYESGHPLTIIDKELADTFAIVTGLKFSTTYLWQVSAENVSGKVRSDIHSFTTSNFPDDFVLYAKRVDGVSQIFVTDTLIQNNIQITHTNYHSWRPVANTQKTKIAFLSTRDLNPQLYTMNMDGSNVNKITSISTGGYYNKGVGFSWLPSGEKLVFSAYNSLYTINLDGTGLNQITSIPGEKHFREVDWSPTGDKIVALTLGSDYYDAEIIIMNADGSEKEVLVGNVPGALGNPVFSIDGNKIIYTYDASGYNYDTRRQLDARIFEYDLHADVTKDISAGKTSGTNDLAPLFTRDGAKIIFINTQNTIGARKDLWIMRTGVTTSTHRNKLIRDVEMCDWSNK